MVSAIGFEVERLHRISFSGITLKGLSEGNWLELSEVEMKVIQDSVSAAEQSNDAVDSLEIEHNSDDVDSEDD